MHWVFYLFLALITFILYKAVINPYIKVLYYRRQGIPIFFRPLIGDVIDLVKSAKEKKGYYKHWLDKMKENPDLKVFGTILGTDVYLICLDLEMIKDLMTGYEKYPRHSLIIKIFKPFTRNGILMLEGKEWKKRRKIISSAFHFEYIKA